ncbi:hypothetical protein VTN00DRAFT_5929 [Thermoascus crustaceus]|uniref:uncharacterized protein n=1 Tax=Thermoascus crustaceus TaxID=5088 RepID=UPI00374479AE
MSSVETRHHCPCLTIEDDIYLPKASLVSHETNGRGLVSWEIFERESFSFTSSHNTKGPSLLERHDQWESDMPTGRVTYASRPVTNPVTSRRHDFGSATGYITYSYSAPMGVSHLMKREIY